jgi:hypothetical protein
MLCYACLVSSLFKSLRLICDIVTLFYRMQWFG